MKEREKHKTSPGGLTALPALLPAVWTLANSEAPILVLLFQWWIAVALVLGPTVLAVVVMLRSRWHAARKHGAWDLIIIILNILVLLYSIGRLYRWSTRPSDGPL